ncbi:MAG TPA: zinc ribbon domain-containing protein [Casimicrobiaceae bacterium]|nr:zinc ribbon domain-containing protein [Casimicrobiaceae bacterium]
MTLLQCLFCDQGNPENAKFCNECGTPLHFKPCRQCDGINARLAESCYRCGSEFAALEGSSVAGDEVSPQPDEEAPGAPMAAAWDRVRAMQNERAFALAQPRLLPLASPPPVAPDHRVPWRALSAALLAATAVLAVINWPNGRLNGLTIAKPATSVMEGVQALATRNATLAASPAAMSEALPAKAAPIESLPVVSVAVPATAQKAAPVARRSLLAEAPRAAPRPATPRYPMSAKRTTPRVTTAAGAPPKARETRPAPSLRPAVSPNAMIANVGAVSFASAERTTHEPLRVHMAAVEYPCAEGVADSVGCDIRDLAKGN